MTTRKAAAPAAAAPVRKAAAKPAAAKPAAPAKPACDHLWIDQVAGDGPERDAFQVCQRCGDRVTLDWRP